MKQASDCLDIDVETIVLEVFSHFSMSAEYREELKEYFAFVDIEWKEILRHVTTQWLSLEPAVNRLFHN
jgi:hypothetical protein